MIRPRLRASLLLVGLLTLSACHAPVTVTTPAGQAAWTADQVAIRVNELMNAAIAAQANGSLPLATARQIVQFAVDADTVLAATPAGWQATIARAWAQAKLRLPPITNPAVQSAMQAVDVFLASQGV